MMLRSYKVAIVAVIGPLTILHLDFFLILADAAAQARGDVNLRKSVPHFLALKFELRTKLVQREPDTRVPIFSNMKV